MKFPLVVLMWFLSKIWTCCLPFKLYLLGMWIFRCWSINLNRKRKIKTKVGVEKCSEGNKKDLDTSVHCSHEQWTRPPCMHFKDSYLCMSHLIDVFMSSGFKSHIFLLDSRIVLGMTISMRYMYNAVSL